MKKLVMAFVILIVSIGLISCTNNKEVKEKNKFKINEDESNFINGKIYTVLIDGNSLSNPTLEIKKWDTVEWVNGDSKGYVFILNDLINEKIPIWGVVRYKFNNRGMFSYNLIKNKNIQGIIKVE